MKKAFTLVELIVVIAILSILVLLIVPQVSAYMNAGQSTVCKNNMAAVIRQYTYNDLMPLADNPYDFKEHLTGICPDGETITYSEDPVSHILTLSCPKHGSLSSSDLAFSENVVQNLNNIKRSVSGKDQTLTDYFAKRPNSTIDSESTSDNSLTTAINSYLDSNHLTNSTSSWQVKYSSASQQYQIIVTSRKLTAADYDSKAVTAVMYTYSSSGTFVSTASGTVSVKRWSAATGDYPMISIFSAS